MPRKMIDYVNTNMRDDNYDKTWDMITMIHAWEMIEMLIQTWEIITMITVIQNLRDNNYDTNMRDDNCDTNRRDDNYDKPEK